MSLDRDEGDTNELIEKRTMELTTEELKMLQLIEDLQEIVNAERDKENLCMGDTVE